jgi:hypothetical protein
MNINSILENISDDQLIQMMHEIGIYTNSVSEAKEILLASDSEMVINLLKVFGFIKETKKRSKSNSSGFNSTAKKNRSHDLSWLLNSRAAIESNSPKFELRWAIEFDWSNAFYARIENGSIIPISESEWFEYANETDAELIRYRKYHTINHLLYRFPMIKIHVFDNRVNPFAIAKEIGKHISTLADIGIDIWNQFLPYVISDVLTDNYNPINNPEFTIVLVFSMDYANRIRNNESVKDFYSPMQFICNGLFNVITAEIGSLTDIALSHRINSQRAELMNHIIESTLINEFNKFNELFSENEQQQSNYSFDFFVKQDDWKWFYKANNHLNYFAKDFISAIEKILNAESFTDDEKKWLKILIKRNLKHWRQIFNYRWIMFSNGEKEIVVELNKNLSIKHYGYSNSVIVKKKTSKKTNRNSSIKTKKLPKALKSIPAPFEFVDMNSINAVNPIDTPNGFPDGVYFADDKYVYGLIATRRAKYYIRVLKSHLK